jgi:hypothetical protein
MLRLWAYCFATPLVTINLISVRPYFVIIGAVSNLLLAKALLVYNLFSLAIDSASFAEFANPPSRPNRALLIP